MRSRRTVLTGIGGVMGTAALAGCSSFDGNGGDGGAPEEAVAAFFEAVFAGDVESANANLHPESVDYPIDSEHQLVGDEGFSLVSVEEISPDEHAEWLRENGGSVETAETIREVLQDEVGASDVASVLITARLEQNDQELEEEQVFFAALTDGEWLVYID